MRFHTLLGWWRGAGSVARRVSRTGRRPPFVPRVLALEDRVVPSTFTVTTTADSGPGSLRQAIVNANNHAGLDTINFNIPGSGVQIIAPASSLPDITDAAVINGASQSGFAGKPVIELSGANLLDPLHSYDGLTIRAGGSTVKALAINGFSGAGILLTGLGGNVITRNFIGTDPTGTVRRDNQRGIDIELSSNNTVGPGNLISGNTQRGIVISGSDAVAAANNVIKGNKIGTDITGTVALSNFFGILLDQANHNTIGGTAPAAGNLISGNGQAGVSIGESAGNLVQGNKIGTSAAGTAKLGNFNGVEIFSSSGNTVGGTAAGAANLISGNKGSGISILGQSSGPATGNLIEGNKIGTNAAGTARLANQFGVILNSAANNTIGGTAAGAGNLISGNDRDGIVFVDEFTVASGNRVQGNLIGTKADGAKPLGNGGHGIILEDLLGSLEGIRANLIGNNIIAFNALAGVTIGASVTDSVSTGNQLSQNAIFSNGGLGIDLGDDGVTANDSADGDTGPNNLQNFPDLIAASSDASSTTVAGTLHSRPLGVFHLEFFASAAADPSGFGEGQTFLGSTTVVTTVLGTASFQVTFPTPLAQGQFVTATATDILGDTSEFSRAKVIGPRLAVGSDAGDPPLVQVYDAPTGQLQYAFAPYPASFRGGVRVAVGDVNGDGVPDVVCAPGPGSPEPVEVFDADSGRLLRRFFPFGRSFDKGVFVAIGEFDGDHNDEIVVSEDAGGSPLVKVFSGAKGHVLAHFLAFDKGFEGGVRLAVGDVNADGHDDIVTAAGPGGPPRVSIFDGTDPAHLLRSFLAYPPSFAGGVYVAAGDLNGDGRAEVVTSSGAGGPGFVKVFDGASGAVQERFTPYGTDFRSGVRVAAVRDLNRDGRPEIITGTGPGGDGEAKVFDGLTHHLLDDLFADSPLGGVFVAGRR